jgi:hypothetical protein
VHPIKAEVATNCYSLLVHPVADLPAVPASNATEAIGTVAPNTTAVVSAAAAGCQDDAECLSSLVRG